MASTVVMAIFGMRLEEINLFPDTRIEEIVQNIQVLLTTVVGSVPLDRSLGIAAEFIDAPQPQAMMKMSIFALETIQQYEPRVEVTEIDFVPNPGDATDGKLYPKVTVRVFDEYLS